MKPTTLRSRITSSAGAWTAAVIVIVISIMSTVTFASPSSQAARSSSGNDGSAGSYATGGDAGSGGTGAGTGGSESTGGGQVVTQGGSGSSGSSGSSGAGSGGSSGAGSGSGGSSGAGSGPSASYDCSKGQNAGASDQGVTANSIAFAATVVQSGIAVDYLQDAESAMEAARTQQNKAGGICGRQITVHYVDDGWNPTTGEQTIQSFISSHKYFGLAVNPSSEGLRGAIDAGLLDQNSFPAVGTDGMLIDQYTDPWVWPVATSTHSVMHIMVQDAYARGARHFGIVWDQNYRFGVEGELAFKGEVERLPGAQLVTEMGVNSGQPSYSTNAQTFVGNCSNSGTDLSKCDFVAMLLEPATAEQWVRDGGLGDGTHQPKYGVGAPQPLFLTSFAQSCGKYCATLQVWTSFNPPIKPYDTDPKVVAYENAVKATSSSFDFDNPESEGAYVGMQLLFQALQQLGASPTRAGMQHVLDATQNFDMAGLAPPISFKSTTPDFADTCAQAFDAIYQGSTFTRWQHNGSTADNYQCDNEVTQDLPGK